MSSTNVITETTPPGGPAPLPPGGGAPSVIREDSPTFARAVGLGGAVLTILCGILLVAALINAVNNPGREPIINPGWCVVGLVLGVAAMLFHAAQDADLQFRRLYLFFGLLLLVVGGFLMVLPWPGGAGDQFGRGVLLGVVGLLFLMAFLRNEADEQFRLIVQGVIAGAGAVMAATGLVYGSIRADFLLNYGLVLALLGLAYLVVAVVSRGVADDRAYWAGVAVGVAGLATFLVALGRSVVPPLWQSIRGTDEPGEGYFTGPGVLLILLGLGYALASALLVSDRPLFALMRRELGGFFYSPIAYLCMFGFTLFSAAWFLEWFGQISTPGGVNEPIIGFFFLSIPNLLVNLFIVPVLTMRLFSEERRSGTYEVLVTSPVRETTVVFSKFFASVLMYLAVFVPTGLFLVSLRLAGAPAFDYRPLMSAGAAWLLTNAGFLALGLFFSSLTKNQIISAILTFAVLMLLTMLGLLAWQLEDQAVGPTSAVSRELIAVLKHFSYLHLWAESRPGRVPVRMLLVPISMTVFFLFLTVKAQEARRWS